MNAKEIMMKIASTPEEDMSDYEFLLWRAWTNTEGDTSEEKRVYRTMTELAALRAITDEARRLLYYRNHTNIIDFQLEKADDYFYNISTELEKLDMLK